LIVLLLCVSAATVPSRTENRGIQARSNAEAIARGLPLVRPRNIPDSESTSLTVMAIPSLTTS
jgi:hypothetical protein